MGMNAGLWIVPAEEFIAREASRVEPRLPKGGRWFDIDEAWYEFHVAFRMMPPPLDRVIGGDIWPEGGLDEDNDSEDATWLGFISPPTVSTISHALERI